MTAREEGFDRLIEPFRTALLAHRHGTDWAELYPDRLGFHGPWDGHHDT
jgi:hypothetical protein